MPPGSGGMVRVSKRRLRESSSAEDSEISSESSLSTAGSSSSKAQPKPPEDDEMVLVPTNHETAAHLVWLGFDEATANHLFNIHSKHLGSGPVGSDEPIITTAKLHIRDSNADAAATTDNWRAAMIKIGISQELQGIILDPKYARVRATHPLKYWLLDTFDLRQRALNEITKKSGERKAERKKKKQKMSKEVQTADVSALSLNEPSRPSAANLAAAPPLKSSHILLWKGLDVARTDGLLKSNGELDDLQTILSLPPGDFNGTSSVWYFNVSRDIAEMYAAWAMARIEKQAGNVCLVAVQVPQALINDMKSYELYFSSDEWKRVVYAGRRGRALDQDLVHLENSDLLTGHICTNSSKAIAKLKDWREIGDDNVLRHPNSTAKARQHVFMLRARFKLMDASKNTMSLHRSQHSK